MGEVKDMVIGYDLGLWYEFWVKVGCRMDKVMGWRWLLWFRVCGVR